MSSYRLWEPAHGRMHVALGNPCESSFVTYAMDA
jgi:hypothetical protein